MIVWRGLGILVGIAGFAGFFIAEAITRSFKPEPNFYQSHLLPKMGGALLGAALAFIMVKLLAKGNAPRVVVDKATGQEVMVRRGDSLFYIPSQYLPYVVLVIGIIVAFVPA